MTSKIKFERFPDGSMIKYGKLEDMDNSFDLEFWQSQPASAIFKAAWEMVVFAHELKGGKRDELRFQRSVASLQRFPG